MSPRYYLLLKDLQAKKDNHMPYNHKCNQCEKDFTSNKKIQKTCSRLCFSNSQRGRIAYNRKVWTNKCDVCKKIVKREYAENRDGSKCTSIYCSKECYLSVHKKSLVDKTCKGCNNTFSQDSSIASKTYCTEKCRRLYGQILVVEKHSVIAVTIDNKFYVKKCIICNDLFNVKKQKAIYKVCSDNCLREHIRTNEDRKKKISKAFLGEKHPLYIKDRSLLKRDVPTKIIKESVKQLFKNKCFKCGSDNNLCIDHHYPNIRGGNLTIGNSVLLCRSCNASKMAKLPKDFYSIRELNKLSKLGIREENLFNFI